MIALKAVFQEMERHLMEDERPSQYFYVISNSPFFQAYPFSLLWELKNVQQNIIHHPEGNVWNHTLLVLDYAAAARKESRNPKAFMWAALLHDIGKAKTTKVQKGRITSYGHEEVGAKLAEEFLQEFTEDEALIKSVKALIRWHMQILFVVNDLPFANIQAMKKEVDELEIALLGWCDRMGRGKADNNTEEERIRLFLTKCRQSHG